MVRSDCSSRGRIQEKFVKMFILFYMPKEGTRSHEKMKYKHRIIQILMYPIIQMTWIICI